MIPFNVLCSRRGFQPRSWRDHIRWLESRPGVEDHDFFLRGKPSAFDQMIVSRSGRCPFGREEQSLMAGPIDLRRQDLFIFQVQGKTTRLTDDVKN